LVALLFSVDGRTHFCFARAEHMDLDMNELLQEACAQLDGKGGGRPQVAQGSAPPAGLRRVTDLLQDLQVRLERW
jgi:alanyl-tRNA synthetase